MAEEYERRGQDGLRLVLYNQVVAQELPHLRGDGIHLMERVTETHKQRISKTVSKIMIRVSEKSCHISFENQYF